MVLDQLGSDDDEGSLPRPSTPNLDQPSLDPVTPRSAWTFARVQRRMDCFLDRGESPPSPLARRIGRGAVELAFAHELSEIQWRWMMQMLLAQEESTMQVICAREGIRPESHRREGRRLEARRREESRLEREQSRLEDDCREKGVSKLVEGVRKFVKLRKISSTCQSVLLFLLARDWRASRIMV